MRARRAYATRAIEKWLDRARVVHGSLAHDRVVRRLITALIVAASVTCLAPTSAHADNVAVGATVLAGTRTITTAALTPLASVLRTASTTGVLTVAVTELGATGVASWSVTAQLCGSNAGLTAPDCAADPNRLVLASDITKKIDGANVHILDRAVTPTGLVGGTSTAVTGDEALTATRTIFGNAGQSTSAVYSGLYTSTSTVSLTPPAAAVSGVYAGYLVVTLVS
jgi:hypothetical protein